MQSSPKAAETLDVIAREEKEYIHPPTRTLERLQELGVIVRDEKKPTGYFVPEAASFQDQRDIERLNTAFGLSGLIDDSLAEEVARMELSLARHNVELRRIVLRYVKSLLTLISLDLAAFLMSGLVRVEQARIGS